VLGRVAADLRAVGPVCRLSPLVFMTDPSRVPDPVSVAKRLPRGAAIIYRHFGQPDAAQDLRDVTKERDQQLLIGNDPVLAEDISADGVHFSRDAELIGPIKYRAKHPDWIITMAGLKSGFYAAPLDNLDALFISAIFPSRSKSAGDAIGVEALKDRAARLPVPLYALGGVNAATALNLIDSGAAGLAAIEGLIMDIRREDTSYGHRFVIDTDHGEAEMTMAEVEDGVFNANHTFVPKALEGRGIAGKLFDAMAADALEKNYKVVPGCPYVAMKFKRKPDVAAAIGA